MYQREMLGLEEVQRAAQAMIQEAQKSKGSGLPIALAVVDFEGHLLTVARMDGARDFNMSMAIRKARTAARWRRDTSIVRDRTRKNGFSVREFGSEYTIVPGGVIITKPGEETEAMNYTSSAFGRVYGAIGVAGRIPNTEDEEIARLGVRAIQEAVWSGK